MKAKNELEYSINIETLLNKNFDDWNIIQNLFKSNPLFFEELLFKIHFKRNKKLEIYQKQNIIKFLVQGYIITQDIRYFNEFLWFYNNDKKYLQEYYTIFEKFKQNTLNKIHPFPLCKKEDVEKFLIKNNMSQINTGAKQKDFKIGLIGPPFLFKNVYLKLKQQNLDVKVFSLTHDTEIKRKLFLKSGIFFKVFNFLKGVYFPYKIINIDYKNGKITKILKNNELDLGFHKLGFIIKENIIDGFKIGLINDHWGVLPFIRGKSTLEYSLLFDFPICATTHFINKEVDTGSIIKIYSYNNIIKENNKIKQIKKKIKENMENRILDSINLICSNQKPILNDKLSGLTFYSMHKFLINYIEKEILK